MWVTRCVYPSFPPIHAHSSGSIRETGIIDKLMVRFNIANKCPSYSARFCGLLFPCSKVLDSLRVVKEMSLYFSTSLSMEETQQSSTREVRML